MSNHRFMGVIGPETIPVGDTNTMLFYFGDPVSQKRINYFNSGGMLLYTTSLKMAHDALGGIRHFEIMGRDSVLVFGAGNDKYAIINFKGDLLSVIDLKDRIKPYKGWRIDYYPTYSGSCLYQNDLFLFVEYYSKSPEISAAPPALYFVEAFESPFFLKISNCTDTSSLDYSFGLFNYYKRFMNDTVAMSELVRYSVVQSDVIVFSIFSDSLYFVSPDTLSLEREFQISSPYTSIGAKPVRLSTPEVYENYLKDVVRYKGFISKVFYDDVIKSYVVVVAHEFDPHKQSFRNYSLSLYSEDGLSLGSMSWPEVVGEQGVIYQYNDCYYLLSQSLNDTQGNDFEVKYSRYEWRIP